jgi:hypothetical protein
MWYLGTTGLPKPKTGYRRVRRSSRSLRRIYRWPRINKNIYADKHRVERNFEEGDLVFLRLQPYRQSSLKRSGAEKLKPRFYGPYRIIRRVGEVAYELELSRGK